MKEDAKETINLPVKKDEFSQKRRVGWAVTGVIILAIEIYIAIFIKGGFIRHYIGDVLATAMLYAFGRAIFRAYPINLAIVVFAISLFYRSLTIPQNP